MWSSVGLEGVRGAGNATWSKSQGGESSLLTQQFVFSVYRSVCSAHACVYVYLWVCMCTLHCNQMRVGFYSTCALCLGEENCPCVCCVCVCLPISRKQSFLGRAGSQQICFNLCNPHPPPPPPFLTLQERSWESILQSEGVSVPASVS